MKIARCVWNNNKIPILKWIFFSITTNTTVKAVVIDGGKASEVVTAEYVIATPEEVANIAEYLAKEDGAVVKFTNPVTAVYQKGAYLYVVDDSGVALIYGSIGQTYDNGAVIPAGFYGTKTTYNGVVELKNEVGAGNSNASFLASTSSVDPINPTVATVADITKENMNEYVEFPERVYYVGRLDKDSQGLLLLTNDGELANSIQKSRNNHEKESLFP